MSTRKPTGRQRQTSKKPAAARKTGSYSKTKKSSKVYIPAYKAIILCLFVIIICLVLLLVSTLSKTGSQSLTQDEISITRRFEDKSEGKEPPAKETPKEEVKPKKTEQPKVKPAEPKVEEKTEQKPEQKVEEEKEEKPAPKKQGFGFAKASRSAQLCFVFDDGGQNLDQLKKFLDLPFPITVAVLPQITHSVEAADLVRKSGNEVILHQPMQSVNASIDPGPGALTPDMTDDQLISQLFVNINQIGPVAGMNNHEGSGITADAEKMALVLQMASENGIYFLDSRTNVETKVPYVAKELGYSYYERNIFLDKEKTRENALAELKKGLALANKNGSVIMIGHIWSADFLPQLLKEAYPELKEKGYTFCVVSKSNALKQ